MAHARPRRMKGPGEGGELVRTAGLEPAAFGSVDRRSDPTELRAHAEAEYTRNGAMEKTERLAEKPGFEPGKEVKAPLTA